MLYVVWVYELGVCVFVVNVLLSLDETYGDIMPVRLDSETPTAFV